MFTNSVTPAVTVPFVLILFPLTFHVLKHCIVVFIHESVASSCMTLTNEHTESESPNVAQFPILYLCHSSFYNIGFCFAEYMKKELNFGLYLFYKNF